MAALNPEQEAAADAGEGAWLVLSGAGTGKTTATIERVVRLVRDGATAAPRAAAEERRRGPRRPSATRPRTVERRAVPPGDILVTTFSRAAAEEFRERLEAALGRRVARKILVCTLHSLGGRLLRERPDIAGLDDAFEILEESDVVGWIKAILREKEADGGTVLRLLQEIRGRDAEAAEGIDRDEEARLVVREIVRFKQELVLPEDAQKQLGQDAPTVVQLAAAVYPDYQAELARDNYADFGDLLLWPVVAMRNDKTLRREWGGRWRFVCVDEFQDVNEAQFRLVKFLAGAGNIFAVGDDDQAIYEFQGASPRYILQFEREFPGAAVLRLETNYRCTPIIIAAASAVIGNNAARREKLLRAPAGAEPGHPVVVAHAATPRDEAAWIALRCAAVTAYALDAGRTPSVFVLYRAGWQSRAIEDAIIRERLPYRLVGDLGFYERREVKDVLGYIRLAVAPDDEEAFERVANVPPRGLGDKTRATVVRRARGGDLMRTLATLADEGALRGDAATTAPGFVAAVRLLAQRPPADGDVGDQLDAFLAEVGYREYWAASSDPRREDRLRNVDEVVRATREAGGLEALLRRAEEAADLCDDDAPLVLMTLHAAKGREADDVFLPGWSEGCFPTAQAVESEAAVPEAIEGERRLAFVGLTRARRVATIVTSEPVSRFAAEIPEHLVMRMDAYPVRPPSPKALRYAQALAREFGVPMPPDATGDGVACSRFIDALQAGAGLQPEATDD